MSERYSQTTVGALCAVVPIRAGYDQAEDLVSCPPFERTLAIASHVSEARESELRHIATCAECISRFREFQEHFSTAPLGRFEDDLSHMMIDLNGEGADRDAAVELCDTYSSLLYSHFSPSSADPLAQHHRAWHATHALTRAIRQANVQVSSRAGVVVFNTCTAALMANAAAYAAVPHSVDIVWPLLECVQEAAAVVASSPTLRLAYTKLWTRMLEEAPITIRTMMHWSLWELAFRQGMLGDIATAALSEALHGSYAHEIAPVAALVFNMHPTVSKSFDAGVVAEVTARYSPELVWMLERAATVRKKMCEIFTDDTEVAALKLARLLDEVYDKPSVRWQLISTIVVRAGIVQAIRDTQPNVTDGHNLVVKIALGIFRDDTDRRMRSLFADLRIYDALRHWDPVGWSDVLLKLVERLPDYERYAVVRSVVAAYEDAMYTTSDSAPRRFENVGKEWIFTTEASRPFDVFCNGLARLANESADYRCHIEWANARFKAQDESSPAQKGNHSQACGTAKQQETAV